MPSVDGRLSILSVWVDPVTMDQALSRVKIFLEAGNRPHAVFAVNPEKNFSVPRNPLLWQVFRDADLLIPDGIGIVWAARVLYGSSFGRVPGVDFMLEICKLASERGYKIFVYGAKEEINKKAVDELVSRYPGLQVAGRANGYVKEEEMPQLIDKINASGAEILFLALGSPKQEQWFSSHRHALQHVKVCQGIGGTLDAITGNVKRAPEAWCRYNLEWLYRLLSEPKRIKRQKVLPVFALLVIIAKLKMILHCERKG